MSPRISPTALLLATGAALPQARADHAPPAAPGRVAFEDSSRSAEPAAVAELPPLPPAAPPRTSPAPRFQLAIGPYTATRTLTFDVAASTAADALPATSPEATVGGLGVAAAVYPAGGRDARGRLVGPGIVVGFRHSLGATAAFVDPDTDEAVELPAVDSQLTVGLGYRQPLGPALVELVIAHQRDSHRIDERPPWLELPDADYRAVAVTARVEAQPRGRTTVAVAAGYAYVLDAGELMAPDGYGAGTVRAYQLAAGVDVPLARALFASASLTYRHTALAFDGDGALTTLDDADVPDVYGAVDQQVDAQVAVGVRY